jgi:DeoR family fructose operon transcriptional repressor
MLDIRFLKEHKTNQTALSRFWTLGMPNLSQSPSTRKMKQFVLENHWPRIPVEGSGQLSHMMRDGSLPARRRFELLRLAQRQGQLFVAELSAQFGVSADTIRRDLDLLSVHGFIRRTHGGAVPADYLVEGGSSSAQRNGARIAEKTRIAQCASELIQDGESLILNGGSTTRLFAFELGGKKDLTVVTNSLGIPAALPQKAVRDILVLGGEYRAESHITVGSIAFCGAIAVHADSAILGAGGISQDGIFAELLQEATMTAKMIAAARRTIVLADSAKFNRQLLGHIASLEKIDILVTDAEPPGDLFAALEERDVQVLVAPPLNANRHTKPPTEYI